MRYIKSLLLFPVRIAGSVLGFQSKKYTRSGFVFYLPLNRWTIMTGFIIAGLVWCPLTMLFTLNHPVRSAYLMTRMGAGALVAYHDISQVQKKVYDKAVPSPVRRTISRYQLDAPVKLATEAAGLKKQPLVARIGGKIANGFKSLVGLFVV